MAKKLMNYFAPPKSNIAFSEGHKSKGMLDDFKTTKALFTQEFADNCVFVGGGMCFAEIYIADNTTAQDIPTGITYIKLAGTAINGQTNNCTADGANTKIIIDKAGVYILNAHFNGCSEKANTTFDGAIFVNGTIRNNVKCSTEFIAADKSCSSNICGLLNLGIGDEIDFRVRHDDGAAVELTIEEANIYVVQIGG